MNSQNIIAFLVYIGIVIACYVCIKEFVHNLLCISIKEKVVVRDTEAKFSIITIVYITCLYVQSIIGLLPLFAGKSHFIFYTWSDHVVYYFFTSIGLFLLGTMNLANTEFLYLGKKVRQVKRIWIILKIGMLPFYLLNGIHYLYAIEPPKEGEWGYALSIVFLIALVPVMLFAVPCVFNFLNGCIGWNYIYYLREQSGDKKHPSKIHYVLQSLPVLDLISMAVILKRYRVSLENEEEITAERILPEEGTAEPEKRKKRKMKDAGIFFGVILFFTVTYFWPQLKEIMIPKPTVYEMTEEEKRLLKYMYTYTAWYEEIETGELHKRQVKELEIIRFALKSIEERYPETQFSIFGAKSLVDGCEFYVREESSGLIFKMYVYDGEELTEQDNLYAYFLREKWNAYIEEALGEKIDGVVKAECSEWKAVEAEKYTDISIEIILEKGLETVPGNVEISISAKGKLEEECREQREMITESIRELQIPVDFWVYFFDETEEEILSEGREEKESYNFWIWSKDFT